METEESGDSSENLGEIKPRPYQAQLEDIAIRNNTIIYLPTGSGKTFIAVSLIKRFREALLKPWGQGGKRTFFLVNNIPLVNQQKKVIKSLCPVTVGAYSGEDGVDYWNKAKWDAELEKNQVIVMTAQILSDMLMHKYINIKDLNLLIFDECHHAVEDHPMRGIMKHFEDCPVHKQPRVLGLTATLLNANVSPNKVEDTLCHLEKTFHASIASVNELGEVLKYSTNPNEMVLYYEALSKTDVAGEVISHLNALQNLVMKVKLPQVFSKHNIELKNWQKDISLDPNKIIKVVFNMISHMISLIEELGVFGGTIGILAYVILLERFKRKCRSKEEEKFYSMCITHASHARLILLNSMQNGNTFNKISYNTILENSSQKVFLLLNTLKEYNPKHIKEKSAKLKVNLSRKPLAGIIFTKQRFTAKVIYNLLKEVKRANPTEFGFLEHDFIVGFNVNPEKNTREDHYLKKASQLALLKFRNGALNCLISTSVIEEGVDIPDCLLVLRFDPPMEYRSYIQSKGRARNSESSYVMLIDEINKINFLKKYKDFQHTEQIIQRLIVDNTSQRELPDMNDIKRELYEDEDIKPFITPKGGRLSSLSAISLLNRYCMMLPHDQFTVITPMWIQETFHDPTNMVNMRLITIIMPIECPIKEEIKGLPFNNSKTAKRSAALNACIRLYEEGELHPDTLLPKPSSSVNFDDTNVKSCFPNWPWDVREDHVDDESIPRPGTKKRFRKYKIEFPRCLNYSEDVDSYYLHLIKLSTAFEKPTEPRERALYELLQMSEGFGFLTQKPLPNLCDFPMFMTVGEVKTSIEVNYAVIKLSPKLLNLIKEFHYFIFDQVLAVAKKFLVFEGKVNCMFVVPIRNEDGYNIDWKLITDYEDIRPVAPLSYEERVDIHVTEENYKYCVVTPWYRESLYPDRYIVSNVLEYMTPQSQFDPEMSLTFQDYYSEKYKLDILGDKNAPLLQVRNISSRMNCLLPRAATIKSFTDKQRKLIALSQGDEKTNRGFSEIFVGEFCIKYNFPGVLWYKAIVLPSILHRIHMLLIAEELITMIGKDIKFGPATRAESWQPIEANHHIAMTSLLAQVAEPTPAVTSIDRINIADESSKGRLNIVSMKESVYHLQQKRINKEYPWDENMEPIDIERNLTTVTLMDLECYDEFVCAPLTSKAPYESAMSPPRTVPVPAAISAPPLNYVDNIQLLRPKSTRKGPELRDVIAALTTINSHDIFNLERAETLGDSFLKYAATLYLFHKFPKCNEGQLSNIKSRLISNRNLYYAGERFNLGGRMKVEQFSPRKDFLVPGFFAPEEVEQLIADKQIRPTFIIGMQFSPSEAVNGQLSEDSKQSVREKFKDNDGSAELEPSGRAQNSMQCYVHHQAIPDKSVADCVEALIGTYLLSGGIPAAIKLLEWMRVIPAEDNLSSLLHKRIPTALDENRATVRDIDFLLNHCRPDIEEILNYKFKDPSYLLEALSHPSYIRNRLTRSYERLEFLGDAILDFLITSHIFENCQYLKPGEITDLRSALVNNVTFAAYVVKLGLHKFLCSELNPTLDKAIIMFEEHQQQRDHEIIEDVLYLIDEAECHVAEYVEVPKVLSDIFEALVGAIYLDTGGDLPRVWSVVYRIMCKEIHAFSARIPQQPVKVLYENIHACPVFGKCKAINPDLPKISAPVTITKNERQLTAFGVGRNKAQAKRAAAKMALKLLSL